jgi:hypothetical protein
LAPFDSLIWPTSQAVKRTVNWANAPGGSKTLRTYYYDTNPLDSTGTFSQYAAGRLTAVQYANIRQNPDVSSNPLPIQLNDMYSYTQAGLPAAKRLQVNEVVYHGAPHYTQTANLDSTYTYNNEGKITAMTYPKWRRAGNLAPQVGLEPTTLRLTAEEHFWNWHA